nr:DUF1298 domain-containing protein [Thermoanaerobacterales bacterium]
MSSITEGVVDRRLPDRLSASDSLMWRIEADPVLRSPILVVALLDRAPDPEGLEAAVRRAAEGFPRMRQRIVPPPLGLGRPRWVDAGPLALDHHVRRTHVPGGTVTAALAVAEPDAVTVFDPARPLWRMTVVEGLDGGRAALVLRFHHTIADGVGSLEVARTLFDTRRRRARAPGGGPGGLRGGADPGAPPLARLVGGAGRLAGDLLRAARRPGEALAAPVRLGRTAARLLADVGSGSPALAGRSLDRRLAVTERRLTDLERAAAVAGGTVNDVLLAAVGGALARYHRHLGHPVREIRVTMPVDIRRPEDPPGGNRFVPVRFTLPVDDPDPAMRVRIAGALARDRRGGSVVTATNVLATALDLLPRPVVARVFGDLLRSIDVDVVDLVGLARPPYLAGARVDRLWAFAPPTGAALSVTLLSHGRTACIALACDRAAVDDPDLMAACLEQGFDEVVAVGRPRRRRAGPAAARTGGAA